VRCGEGVAMVGHWTRLGEEQRWVVSSSSSLPAHSRCRLNRTACTWGLEAAVSNDRVLCSGLDEIYIRDLGGSHKRAQCQKRPAI
jgi:hypothetical protein